MTRVSVQGVQARLPQLLERVEQGEKVAITRRGLAVADLVPRVSAQRRTGRGAWKGRVDMSRFDEADDEIAREFGMLE